MGLLSVFGGRSKCSGTQAAAPEEQRIPTGQLLAAETAERLAKRLLAAEAKLARLEALPESYFTVRLGHPDFNGYSVDRKADAIARAKADIAELKVLVRGEA